MKSIPAGGNICALLENLYAFVSGSTVHPKWIDIQKRMHLNEQPRELKRLCETRWASRIDSCRTIRDRLGCLRELLLYICETDKPSRVIHAKGLLLQMDFRFVLMLNIMCKVLSLSKSFSDFLQKTEADLAQAMELALSLKNSLNNIRNDPVEWECIWNASLDQAALSHISVTKVISRSRKMPQYLDDYIVCASNIEGRDDV